MLQHLLYIDPGSGFGIAQILTAIGGAILIFWVRIKLYLKAFFSRFKGGKESGENVQ